MKKVLLLASLILLSSCRNDSNTKANEANKVDPEIADESIINFAFELFRDDLNQDLFLIDFDPEVNQELSLTEVIDHTQIWERKMANIGHKISNYADKIDFSQKDLVILRDITKGLRELGVVLHNGEDLFDHTLAKHATLIGNATPEFDHNHFVRRNYLAVLVAVQWHLQAVRLQEYPEWEGSRGGAVIHENHFIPRLYAKYIAFENNINLDFDKNIDEIYKELSEKLHASKTFNTFAYSRQKPSSHLRQVDLKDVYRFGIDIRFLKHGNALPILPNDGRHIHVGTFKFEEDGKNLVFFKEEARGFSTKSDKFFHAAHYVQHRKTGKAKTGPRETNTPNDLLDQLVRDLSKAGYKNGALLSQLRIHNSEITSLNVTLKQLISDISLQDDAQVYYAILNNLFDRSDLIGSEYVLTNEKISRPIQAHTFKHSLGTSAKIKTKATSKTVKHKYKKIKWPVSSRLKL